MTLQIALVLCIATVATFLFVTAKLRVDVGALLVLVSLALLGLVTPAEALSGFANEATISVAAMFILAAGLENTGALAGIGRLLTKSGSPTVFLLVLFALLALISPFVSNTAVVAVFIPIVISASLNIGLPPTKVLIPLSYVSQMTGVCTLIGTSTNLIVNSLAKDLGHRGFSMFEFLPLGVLCALAGCTYLLTLGRWMLPAQGNSDLSMLQESGHYVTELRVGAQSQCLGQSVEDTKISSTHQVYVLQLWRGEEKLWSPKTQQLQEGDILLVRGRLSRLQSLQEELGLEYHRATRAGQDGEAGAAAAAADSRQVMAEVMITPNSALVGHRLQAVDRRLPRHSSILALQRRGQIVREQLDAVRLAVGDILLGLVPEPDLAGLRSNNNIIVLSERTAPLPRGWRAPFALATMALVVVAAALDWTSIAIAALGGALLMVLTRCVDTEGLYDAVDARILLLMAGLLPLGTAVSNSGAAQFIVDHTIGLAASHGPHVMLAALYLMALVLGELMSNAAAAVRHLHRAHGGRRPHAVRGGGGVLGLHQLPHARGLPDQHHGLWRRRLPLRRLREGRRAAEPDLLGGGRGLHPGVLAVSPVSACARAGSSAASCAAGTGRLNR